MSVHRIEPLSERLNRLNGLYREHLLKAADLVAQHEFERFICQMSYGPESESPAEDVFAAWFYAVRRIESVPFELDEQKEVTTPNGKKYRLDFALEYVPVNEHRTALPIAIEIDGHAFHEKTKEQVSYRNTRDRALQAMGYQVFHFSFSELTSEPQRCVDEVMAAGLDWYFANVGRSDAAEHLESDASA